MKEFFITSEKNKLNVITNDNEFINKEINTIVINLHGVTSHFQHIYDCEDYIEYRFNLLKKINICSYALEFHGHGKSEGVKCLINNFDDLLTDFDNLLKYIKNKYINTKIFVIASSMGGAVAIKYCILNKDCINGLILLSPMCGIDKSFKPNKYLVNILLYASKYFPSLPALPGISKKKKVVIDEYEECKFNCKYGYHDKFRLSTGRECYLTSLWMEENCHKFNLPLFLIHGLNDEVTPSKSSLEFFNSCISEDKIKFTPDTKNHSLLVPRSNDDILPKQIISKIILWIEKRI